MSVVLGVSAVDSPGLADVEERGQSVEPQLSGEADASPLQQILTESSEGDADDYNSPFSLLLW